jgi:hypothetical protein
MRARLIGGRAGWASTVHAEELVMSISLSTHLATQFDDAVGRTREALTQQGFGVLTEIDVRAEESSIPVDR